jgi:hypothetical protein
VARRTPARKPARRVVKRTPASKPALRVVKAKVPPATSKPVAVKRAATMPVNPIAQAPPPLNPGVAAVKPVAAKPSSTPAPRQAARPAAPPPGLQRERRRLPDAEAFPPTPPSSLDLDRHPSAARSGQSGTRDHLSEHNETSPALTGGDVDADWEQAYSSGDEAPGGDNPTPDQDIVDEIGRALGLEYDDDEELKGAGKLEERDKHRWELDPASAEDFEDREE